MDQCRPPGLGSPLALFGVIIAFRSFQTVTDVATELSEAKFGAFFYNVLDEQGESYMLYTLSGAHHSAFEK